MELEYIIFDTHLNKYLFKCLRCKKSWVPKSIDKETKKPVKIPRLCASCKSPYWSTPKKERKLI